jgi:superfamily II DNA or RNA helicase
VFLPKQQARLARDPSMIFSETDIRNWVGPDTYRHALEAALHLKRVSWGEAAHPGDLVATARVPGRETYETTLYFIKGAFSSTCTCGVRVDCRHGAALALVVRDQAIAGPAAARPANENGWERRLAGWTAAAPTAPLARATFTYRLRWPVGPNGAPELQVQVSHSSSPTFLALAWHIYKVSPGDPEPDVLVEPALRRIRARRPEYRDGATRTSASWLVVPDEFLDDLLPKLGLHPRVQDERCRPLLIHPTVTLQASLSYQEGPAGPQLRPIVTGPGGTIAKDEVVVLGPAQGRWAVCRGEVFRLAPAAEAVWANDGLIDVPDDERQAFEGHWLPALVARGVLVDARVPALGEWPLGTPRPQLILEEEPGVLVARAGFVYRGERVEATKSGEDGAPAGLVGPPGGPFLRRDGEAEAQWRAALKAVLPSRILKGDAALGFLETGLVALAEAGWDVVGRAKLRDHRLALELPVGRMSVSSGTDWFDIHSELLVGAEAVRWQTLQAALESGSRYVKLGSGDWARLPAEWLSAQQRLAERLTGKPGAPAALGPLRVPRYQAPLIAEVLQDAGVVAVDAGWLAFRERLATFGGVAPVALSAEFQGTLRPYQVLGLAYLVFLRDYGLHGILADDMGLGKTVQTAALLAANYPSEGERFRIGGPGPLFAQPETAIAPTLIIAPTSVVANWEMELRRFVPTLRILRLHGPERRSDLIANYDVVITSYATARLDLEVHQTHTYHTLILDEAQVIKNGRSQTAIAMRLLKAHHRLCLTGTPIENDVTDVWSLFTFLMPGLLGSEAAFRARYATPILANEPGAREALRERIAPFILRRLKAAVAPDLPPRTDITLYCDLLPAQRRAYDALLTSGRERIQGAVERRGLAASRITILDTLLKLRQACCHPALLGTTETLHLDSGKLEMTLQLIQELIAGGHRALIFSQFTRMLAILRERLDEQGVAYEYLDGRTRDRQARVERFNSGTAPLFLISLKAGGTGLNLTGADYVIHYDPWWNPASEDQATDRAHRIGQTRQVFSYKLVARNTIEEKLVLLQERKRGLVSDLLASEASGKSLTAEDVALLFD